MCFESHYIPAHDIVVQRWSGVVTVDAAVQAKHVEMDRAEHGPDTVWLADARGVDVDVTFLPGWTEAVTREFPGHLHPLAIVVDMPRATAVSMLLAKENESRSKQTQVFSTVESAMKWLGRDPLVARAAALGL